MKNSLEKGSVRYIVFKEQDTWYAVGLEFNIVESGTTPQEALLLLFEALEGYVETVRKIKIRPHVLNQKPDVEYEQLWLYLNNQKQKMTSPKSTFANKEIFTVGQFALA
jgi:hypothetical protein